MYQGDFPGGTVVKTLPSNAGAVGSIPGQGAYISHASWLKNSNIIINSVKPKKAYHWPSNLLLGIDMREMKIYVCIKPVHKCLLQLSS